MNQSGSQHRRGVGAGLIIAVSALLSAAVFELYVGQTEFRPDLNRPDDVLVQHLIGQTVVAAIAAYGAVALCAIIVLAWRRAVFPLLVLGGLLIGGAWVLLSYAFLGFIDCYCEPPAFDGPMPHAWLLLSAAGIASIAAAAFLAPKGREFLVTSVPTFPVAVPAPVTLAAAIGLLVLASTAGTSRGSHLAGPPPTATSIPPTSIPPTPIVVTPGVAHLRDPISLAVDRGGIVWVLEGSPNRVVALGPRGGTVTSWSIRDARTPADLSVDRQSKVYVADVRARRVFAFTGDGQRIAALGDRGLRAPSSVWTPDGPYETYLMVVDPGDHSVWYFSPGDILRYGPYPHLKAPTDIASPDGHSYFVLYGGRAVLRIDQHGHTSRGSTWPPAGELNGARGIAVNSRGRVVVADTGNNRIELFTLRGKLLAEWSTQGWRKPSDVAMDKQGHVYVADTGNNRIVELSFSGHILRTWR